MLRTTVITQNPVTFELCKWIDYPQEAEVCNTSLAVNLEGKILYAKHTDYNIIIQSN